MTALAISANTSRRTVVVEIPASEADEWAGIFDMEYSRGHGDLGWLEVADEIRRAAAELARDTP